MKIVRFLVISVLSVVMFQSTPLLAAPSADTNAPVNYVVKVLMEDSKGETSSIQVTTVEGSFTLDTIQKNSVKISGTDIPTTLKLEGTLTALSNQKGLLKIYLGHTVPYVTSTSNNGGFSSYSQLSVGLDSSFVVTYGKPLVVQLDDSGEVSVLVTREDN